VRDQLQGLSGPLPDAIFGLLALAWKERTVLGTEQGGRATCPAPARGRRDGISVARTAA
jgi:hypothetical protein